MQRCSWNVDQYLTVMSDAGHLTKARGYCSERDNDTLTLEHTHTSVRESR
jgi:hypothetical protein